MRTVVTTAVGVPEPFVEHALAAKNAGVHAIRDAASRTAFGQIPRSRVSERALLG